MDERERERKTIVHRLWGFAVAIFVIMGILGFNMWRLQIVEEDKYTALAQANFRQTVTIEATRGDIQDRSGKVLVTSVPEFVLTLDMLELKNGRGDQWQEVIYKLAEYIKPFWPNEKQNVESIYEDILAITQNNQWEQYRPIRILQSASDGLRAIVAEHQDELPGVNVEAMPVRAYPQGTLLGHVLGYVREISDSEMDQFNGLPEAQAAGFKYEPGDIVGKTGVEKTYDFWLRGRIGQQLVEVDKNARPISKDVLEEPIPGNTIQLTIDADLQKTLEDSIESVLQKIQGEGHPDAQAAAGVVIDVNTGKILAMASHPTMDPNDLTGIISEESAQKYFREEKAASLNRAISGRYAPGSTFKMITAMAALQSGVTTPNEKVYDTISSLGSMFYQSQGFPEWGGNNFQWVNIKEAIAHSANIYFEVVGARVFDKAPELIKQVANEFGLGVLSGIDLPGEVRGIAPSQQWKIDNYRPGYEKDRDEALEAIEKEYSEKLAAETDEKKRDQLLKQKEQKEKNVQTKFIQNITEFVDWKYYDSYNNSIGQGYNAYTPLQLANYVATIVNGGKHYQPYVVDKIIDTTTGEVIKENQPTLINNVSIDPDILEEVKKGMSMVTDPKGFGTGYGTASSLFLDLPEFTGGGKTGTAQIGSKDTISGELYNGMFVAFAPYDNPQIAFAGVVEYGGHGGDTAGRVAKAVFKQYFGW